MGIKNVAARGLASAAKPRTIKKTTKGPIGAKGSSTNITKVRLGTKGQKSGSSTEWKKPGAAGSRRSVKTVTVGRKAAGGTAGGVAGTGAVGAGAAKRRSNKKKAARGF